MPLQYVGMPLHCVRASFQPVHASRQPVRQPIPPAGTGQPQAGEPILYDRTRQQAVGGDEGVVGVRGPELFRAHAQVAQLLQPILPREREALLQQQFRWVKASGLEASFRASPLRDGRG
jgi:hypothetical protein